MPPQARPFLALLLLAPSLSWAGPFRFTTIDIGQGDGAVVVAPSGCAALLDGGPTGSGTAIKAYLKSIGVTQVDFAVMSHHHADHLGGIDEVDVGTDAVPIAAVYDRGGTYSSSAFTEYSSHFSGKRSTPAVGQVIWLCNEVKFTVVAVNGNGGQYQDENSLSLTVKIAWQDFDAVVGGDLTGDAASGKDVESLIAPSVGPVELYKVHHHGSRYSSTSTFLSTITPKVSFISVGFDNTYGHPTQEAKNRIAATGSAIWQTEDPATQSKRGDIELTTTDSRTFTVKQGTNTVSYTGHLPADSQPPSAPSNLVASAPSHDQVDLSWSASTDNIGVTSYEVRRSTNGGTSYVTAGTSATTGFADLGLTGSTTYTYQVTARDLAGNVSAPSNTASVTTPAQPPPPPGSLSVTSPNGGESWAAGSVHDITWTSSGVTNVAVDYSLDGGGTWTVVTSSTPASTGAYSWTVPGSASTNARVRVKDTLTGGPADMSDASFAITASPAVVFLNEVLANEPGSSTAGEFVEIVNTGGTSIAISGWTIRTGTGTGTTRHTFAAGTTLAPRQAISVFSQASGIPAGTTGAIASSTGSLGLLNSGQTVSLRNASGTTISSMTYSSGLAAQDGVSANRSPDGSSTGTWVLHNTLSSLKASPGKTATGGAF